MIILEFHTIGEWVGFKFWIEFYMIGYLQYLVIINLSQLVSFYLIKLFEWIGFVTIIQEN
jgi:hypothetical protein